MTETLINRKQLTFHPRGDHEPEYSDFSHHYEPNPSKFLRRTRTPFLRCCGQRMLRVKCIEVRVCWRCMFEERFEITDFVYCNKCKKKPEYLG
jgi:hypothetical protein